MINRRELLGSAASAALVAGTSGAHGGFLRGAIGIPLQTTFSFTVGSTSTTSAGVFDSNNILVRTLWSNVQYTAGTYTATWDGTLDNLTGIGSVAATGAYTIKVLSSQVAYAWQGVIGNTSASWTDATTLHSLDVMFGMAISGTNIYFCTGYNEQGVTIFKVSTSNPQSKTALLPTHHGINTYYVATDGTNVYWAAQDPGSAANGSWVYASTVAADAAVTFSSGTNITPTFGTTISGIDQATATGFAITGLAVQSGGLGYVCISRTALGTIDVCNKTTGALLSSNTITTPAGLATDASNGLWVIEGTSVVQYTINSGGTLTATGVSITGLVAPLAVAVSPDGTTILVADGGSSQQVKAFSSTTGASSWTYGTAGGYATNGPAVNNSKFYFTVPPGLTFSSQTPWTYLAFQSDGSFWVGDPGNYRNQYFTAGPTPSYSNTIMWLPSFYSCNVDPNNPVRVFANALEFQIDYTKTLGPANGSWTLVNNWLPGITTTYYDKYGLMSNVATLSNGRTYCQLHNLSSSKLEIVELITGSGLRFTGVVTPSILYVMAANGDLTLVTWPLTTSALGQPIVFSKQALTGFDGSNNPTYGALTTVATSPAIIANGPAWYESAGTFATPWRVTTSGIIPVFDGSLPSTTTDAASHAGWHLGGLNVSTGLYQWQNSPAGPANYMGAWMTDGTFEIGNLVVHGGSRSNVLGRNIFDQYFGESWKAGETNEYSHFWDDGLMVGQFGVTGPSPAVEGLPGMAGNAFSNTVVQDVSGGVHVYHNDESWHGGIGRWDITGLPTIAEQSFSCRWYSFQYQAASDPTDMLAGLPYSASVVSGTPAAWTYSPTTQITTSQVTNYWTLTTNVLEHNTRLSPDIFMNFAQSMATSGGTLPFTATLTLPTPSPSTTSWNMSATIAWFGQNIGTDGVYFDILDNVGDIITRIYPIQITPGSDYRLIANGQNILTVGTSAALQAIVNPPTALTISASGAVLTITYTGYAPITASVFNPSATWNEPASIVMTFFSTSTVGYLPHKIGFQTLHFSHVP